MKKGWQKRLWRCAFKSDFTVGYGEYLFQYTVWGIIIFGLLALIEYIFFRPIFNFYNFALFFLAGLFGTSIAYFFKKKK